MAKIQKMMDWAHRESDRERQEAKDIDEMNEEQERQRAERKKRILEEYMREAEEFEKSEEYARGVEEGQPGGAWTYEPGPRCSNRRFREGTTMYCNDPWEIKRAKDGEDDLIPPVMIPISPRTARQKVDALRSREPDIDQI